MKQEASLLVMEGEIDLTGMGRIIQAGNNGVIQKISQYGHSIGKVQT